MSKEADKLEEENKLEICNACYSLHIIETKKGVICGTCQTENYTSEIMEDAYNTLENFGDEQSK